MNETLEQISAVIAKLTAAHKTLTDQAPHLVVAIGALELAAEQLGVHIDHTAESAAAAVITGDAKT